MKKLVLAFVLLNSAPCNAQEGMTAELTGRVSSKGQPLPGVTITLRSNALQAARIALTGANGGYLFPLLPPGQFNMRVALDGFSAVEENVRATLAETSRVDIELSPSPVIETINVDSRSAQVPASLVISTNVRASELERLPVVRDIRSAVLLSPAANQLGQKQGILISGAASWDSLYLVDGVPVNEYLSGQPNNLFIGDAIEEITLLTGNISAEYGRFTGGVVTTLTRSGGNEFHGSLRDTVANGAWTSRSPEQTAAPLDRANHGVEATLGGFLLKDRLWFFAAGREARESDRKYTALTVMPYQFDNHDRRRELKLTAQAGRRQTLMASWIDSTLTEINANDGGALDEDSLIPRRSQPSLLLGVTY